MLGLESRSDLVNPGSVLRTSGDAPVPVVGAHATGALGAVTTWAGGAKLPSGQGVSWREEECTSQGCLRMEGLFGAVGAPPGEVLAGVPTGCLC